MPNLLLLDDGEVAGRAMQGIADRSRHRCVIARKGDEAWQLLRQLVMIDLVVVELRLQGEDGAAFIQRLRTDPTLKHVPVVVYTSVADHGVAARVKPLGIQNYLFKPYSDEAVQAEIAKAAASAWRSLTFEEERSFCAQMGHTPEGLRRMREDLVSAMAGAAPQLAECAGSHDLKAAVERMTALSEAAQTAGFWGLVEYLQGLQTEAEAGHWMGVERCREPLEYLGRLVFCHLHPNHVPPALVSERERKEKDEAKEQAFWQEANVDVRSPVLPTERVFQQLDALTACPVVDGVGAAFQMAVAAKSANLRHLTDLVCRDPALSFQVLIAANSLEREDHSPVEDPRLAVPLLGDLRIASLARQMPVIADHHVHQSAFVWSHYWLFQMGVAHLAQFTCKYLEFTDLLDRAYTAGLVHDVGRLLLLGLHPHGVHAMLSYAAQRTLTLSAAEMKYLGCTSRDLACRFAAKHHLPEVYQHVLQWVETPEAAARDAELVAVVALARAICRQNHLGSSGDPGSDAGPPLEETRAWEALRLRVFPSFNLRSFEAQSQEYCRTLKLELLGRTA